MKAPLEKILHGYFPLGFHLSRRALQWLQLSSPAELAPTGKVPSGNYAVRRLADIFNERRFHSARVTEPVQAGQLISVGVIVDILRYLAVAYCQDQVPGVVPKGVDWVAGQRGRNLTDKPPQAFLSLFPPPDVLLGEQTEPEYLSHRSEIAANAETVVTEMILLYLAMINPAFRPFQILFDDDDLKRQAPYIPYVDALEDYFGRQPAFEPLGLPLFLCLRAPMQAAPESLEGQLHFMREHWASFLPPELLERLLLAVDILREEVFLRGLGPGPNRVMQLFRDEYGIDHGYSEPAAFTPDADWMANVVLIAKSALVWLDQLSKKYQRHIRVLSDIPDEELDGLARWGFTGLWLIGVWERSPASQAIKRIMGNPEAESSAYSVFDYVIADELGGETAYQDLRLRAWRRGIRLASDMVPNHMGVYSKWVIEHPGWFLQSPYPPFPCYQYTGQDLSSDQRVVIQIEDGYWSHSDAAVVFKRYDKWTGDAAYLYHGNDGTSMPWNDTAQLNFMMPEVREAVIQTILHVARKFPIIRFDAAMTLAKRHYQRLWFPQHGEGGAIPSRAEYGLSKAEFDAAFPKEFWREVVDRVTAEVPDTLLLAEAFWLMEGYFVRTLGMHRVYNSAFMNMLKMEENANYRTTVKNVLEFSPEVLKRFVNFMNNPDERTAVEQFGRGDKYFGAALMMVTMPGLPMFGHGQIEGFTEKYGMEYRRAYWDEAIDEEMVRRHEMEIFPLMRRRRLFSGAAGFALYDFVSPQGWVDENVFAYSNRSGEERAIIVYNNAYATTSGRIHTSTQINVGTAEQPMMIRRTLAEALGLNTGEHHFYAFRDHKTGLEYLRGGRQIADEGLFAELQAYQYQAFLDFREIYDGDGSWQGLRDRLAGAGVVNLQEAYREMHLEPVRGPFRAAFNGEILGALLQSQPDARSRLSERLAHLLAAAQRFVGASDDLTGLLGDILTEIDLVLRTKPSKSGAGPTRADSRHIALLVIIVRHLARIGAAGDGAAPVDAARQVFDAWLLQKAAIEAFRELGEDNATAGDDALLAGVALTHRSLLTSSAGSPSTVTWRICCDDPLTRQFLRMNWHRDLLWLSKEQLERMITVLTYLAEIGLPDDRRERQRTKDNVAKTARRILDAAERAGYQVERMIALMTAETGIEASSGGKEALS